MKITRLGPTRPLISLTGLLSGGDAGPAGQVPTSVGSNGAIAWGSNVSLITVNSTTKVLGPYVNFANGSNTTVTVDQVGSVASNTIRIHATGGAASFGSNSNAVGEANAPGASSDSSRADHVHLGVRTISHASNTFAGPITFTTSGLLGITSPSAGTLNFSSTGAAAGAGGITVSDEGSPLSTAATTLDFVGAGVTASGTGATKTITIPGGGGGASYGQVYSYPTSFTGDTIDGSSTTPFVDVAAFDTKAVRNSRILHLQTLGASKSQRVRVTLGTTKAAAFDVRVAITTINQWWSNASGDNYCEVRLSTSGDSQLAIARIYGVGSDSSQRRMTIRWGGSSTAFSSNENWDAWIAPGEPITMRFARDGSDVITFWYGLSNVPMALVPVLRQGSGTYGTPYTQTVSGTLARIEIAHVSVSGVDSAFQMNTWVDYVQSV